MRRLIALLLPFFLICVVLSAFILGILLLSYLFLIGAAIGIVFIFIAWIRKTFFPPKITSHPPKKHTGRIIDSDEWNQL